MYVEDHYFGRCLLEQILEFISRSGYGADKTVGRGAFEFDLSENWDLCHAASPNSFIALAHYHPQLGEFVNGHYDIITKFGKLGGHWAAGFSGGPHKMPLVMFLPGSSFAVKQVKSFYGGLVRRVHNADHRIVHYGIALPLMVRSE